MPRHYELAKPIEELRSLVEQAFVCNDIVKQEMLLIEIYTGLNGKVRWDERTGPILYYEKKGQ